MALYEYDGPQYYQDPTQRSALGKFTDALMYAVDTPGSLLRGVLSGAPGSRKSGREMLETWGLVDPKSSTGTDYGDVAGLAADLVVDPLNLIGAGLITKGAKGLHAALKGAKVADAVGDVGKAATAVEKINPFKHLMNWQTGVGFGLPLAGMGLMAANEQQGWENPLAQKLGVGMMLAPLAMVGAAGAKGAAKKMMGGAAKSLAQDAAAVPVAKEVADVHGAPMKPADFLTPHRDLTSDAGYVYHATNIDNASEIASQGRLMPHKPWYGTDQGAWPDGSTALRSYYTENAGSAWQFAPEQGQPVLLRVKKGKYVQKESTGDMFVERRAVPVSAIEVATTDGKWVPLKKAFATAPPVADVAPGPVGSPAFNKWWTWDWTKNQPGAKPSYVTDRLGNPLRVQHETNEAFDTFKAGEFGFHFGEGGAAGMYGDPMDLYASISNPLRLRDLGVWSPLRVLDAASNKLKATKEEIVAARKATEELGERLRPILEQSNDMVANREAHYEWSRPVRELIKKSGYDGIIYKNEAEGFGNSYIAFDPPQLKSPSNRGTWSPTNPNILMSSATGIPGAIMMGTAAEGEEGDWQRKAGLAAMLAGAAGTPLAMAMLKRGGAAADKLSLLRGRLMSPKGVEQVSLARPEPVIKPELAKAIAKKKPALESLVDRGLAMGGEKFYYTNPVLQEFVRTFGEEEGIKRFNTFMELVGATTSNSPVASNIRRASFWYQQAMNDKIPEAVRGIGNAGQKVWNVPEGYPIPPGYGTIGQGQELAIINRMLSGNYRDPTGNVVTNKIPSFAENLKGNAVPVTADRHMFRAIGLDRPSDAVYPHLERMVQQIAAERGITPAEAQSAIWSAIMSSGAGRSTAEPFAHVLEQVVQRQADNRGISPRKLLEQFKMGQTPLAVAPTLPGLGVYGLAPEGEEGERQRQLGMMLMAGGAAIPAAILGGKGFQKIMGQLRRHPVPEVPKIIPGQLPPGQPATAIVRPINEDLAGAALMAPAHPPEAAFLAGRQFADTPQQAEEMMRQARASGLVASSRKSFKNGEPVFVVETFTPRAPPLPQMTGGAERLNSVSALIARIMAEKEALKAGKQLLFGGGVLGATGYNALQRVLNQQPAEA